MPATGVPSSARTARRFFATWNDAPALRAARPEIAHFGDRHAGIVGDDHRSRLRQRALSGFRRLPLFWLFPLSTSPQRKPRGVPTASPCDTSREGTFPRGLPSQGSNPNPVWAGTFKSLRTPAVSDRSRRSPAGILSTTALMLSLSKHEGQFRSHPSTSSG